MGNTRERYFSHFSIIEANQIRGFGAFRNNNNNNLSSENNNNNNLLLLLLLGFEGGLREGFNSLSKGNVERLDLNIAALVNVLTRANLRINHIKKKSNHVKPTEFRGTEAEDLNE